MAKNDENTVYILSGKEAYITSNSAVYLRTDHLRLALAESILKTPSTVNEDFEEGFKSALRWLKEDLEKVEELNRQGRIK